MTSMLMTWTLMTWTLNDFDGMGASVVVRTAIPVLQLKLSG
ncbi:MAG TPA: hypothetical protein VGM18_06325 [Candidatus Sulfotelmatobacter sp.]